MRKYNHHKFSKYWGKYSTIIKTIGAILQLLGKYCKSRGNIELAQRWKDTFITIFNFFGKYCKYLEKVKVGYRLENTIFTNIGGGKYWKFKISRRAWNSTNIGKKWNANDFTHSWISTINGPKIEETAESDGQVRIILSFYYNVLYYGEMSECLNFQLWWDV